MVDNFVPRLTKSNLASKSDNSISDFVKEEDFDQKLQKNNKKLLKIKQNMYK